MLKLEYWMIDGDVIKCQSNDESALVLSERLNKNAFVVCDCYGEIKIVATANISSVKVEEQRIERIRR